MNGREQSPFGRINAPDYDWNAIHNVSLQVNGNTFTTYIDDQEVISAIDDTYTSGAVGFRTWGSSKSSFDIISIVEP